MELEKTTIDGLEAIVLESDRHKVLILPELGAKLASLVFKETDKEFLWRNPARSYRRPAYGDMFDFYDISGFDECFPNIGAGFYPAYPWQGIALPDHGELWTIPWGWEFANDRLHLWCHGMRLPYRFDKWITGADEDTHLHYKVTNHTPYPLKCVWSAHPLFDMRPNTRIVLPQGVRVRIAWSKDSRLGPLCAEHDWPVTKDAHGREVDLSVVASGELGFADKIFTTKLTEGWCALHDPKNGDFAAFAFSPEQVPYVGVWINQGGWPLEGETCFNVALEPCTGYPDQLDIALLRNEVTSVPAKGTLSWRLKLQVGRTDDILSVVRQGS